MIYENITALCRDRGISVARVERETGLGNGTISRWKRSEPSAAKLKLVADYFGVSVDSLLAQHEHNTTTVQ